MIRLRPYNVNDVDTILSWSNDERAFYKWSAGVLGEYPITKEQFEFVNNLMAFTAIDEDEVVGFFIVFTVLADRSCGAYLGIETYLCLVRNNKSVFFYGCLKCRRETFDYLDFTRYLEFVGKNNAILGKGKGTVCVRKFVARVCTCDVKGKNSVLVLGVGCLELFACTLICTVYNGNGVSS